MILRRVSKAVTEPQDIHMSVQLVTYSFWTHMEKELMFAGIFVKKIVTAISAAALRKIFNLKKRMHTIAEG